ncbi:hypothetical protein [Microbacterium sp. TNHR37B]|uniref:hypothetical protein n=1 Tax=Microbacterium sp. TNHR37B TaxID=1775956 RepID=UPI0007B1EEFA|nr:hypothetical protein [Microbacterium sp. TNHR37B]KZE89126.1 hypothetical protein AVP41_01918 [Microbacterium sp. TNHR37B]
MDATEIAGRVTITARAYERIAAAVAADALGVPPRDPKATVRDEQGRLRADVSSGIDPRRADPAGRGVVAAAVRARRLVAERLNALTGADVARVRIHLTHVVDTERRAS